MNFLKSIADSINYEDNDKPFFKSRKFDGMVKYIHFYQNAAILKKGKSFNYFYKDVKKSNSLVDKIKKLLFIFNN